MFQRRRAFPVIVGMVLLHAGIAAQGPPRPEADAQRRAMARLDYLDGQWDGEGWIEMGGRRLAFRGGERVQRKLDGLALLVEGAFFARPPGSDRDIPVHTTLGVISYDAQAQEYRFHTWLATGSSGIRTLTVTDEGWSWELKSPQAVVRYTMTRPTPGEWHEIGARSTDGQTWRTFFEMRLTKRAGVSSARAARPDSAACSW